MPKAEIPNWVEKTPDSCEYCLTMYDTMGGSVQTIPMNRKRFLQLKEHLAALRGYRRAEEMAQFAETRNDQQQLAFTLEDAQEFYRTYPALVMGEFPPEWNYLVDPSHPDYPSNDKGGAE